MAYEILIVAYDSADRASAVRELRRAGVPANEIKRHPVSSTSVEEISMAPMAETSSGFWGWLFGENAVEKRRLNRYRKALSQGGTVITVRVLEEETGSIRAVLEKFGPLDLAEAEI